MKKTAHQMSFCLQISKRFIKLIFSLDSDLIFISSLAKKLPNQTNNGHRASKFYI